MTRRMTFQGSCKTAANRRPKRLKLRQFALGFLALTLADTADAAPAVCGRRAEILAQLAEQFREAPAAIGLDNGGSLIEILSTDSGSTWSIIVTTPRGISCIVAAGESWQELMKTAVDGPQA